MSTLPSRMARIRPAIEAALAQLEPVAWLELNLPYRCIRTGEAYAVPAWLEQHPDVRVHRCADFGPITKVAPTLLRHRDQADVRVYSIDDDFALGRYELATLAHAAPDRIVCKHGWGFDGAGVRCFAGVGAVPNFEGYGGVLYPPQCVGEDFAAYVVAAVRNPACRLADDVVLGHYFARAGVPILIVNRGGRGRPFHPAPVDMGDDPDACRKQGDVCARYHAARRFLEARWPSGHTVTSGR